MRVSTLIFAVTSCLSSVFATPLAANDISITAPETRNVADHYDLLHLDLPEDLHADNNTHLTTEEYHHKLRARGCDPIGCYANGYFSVIFNPTGHNYLNLFGEGQPEQNHWLICSDNFQGFNSWLPFVFMSRAGLCHVGLVRRCCNSYDEIFFKYSYISTKPKGDSRCSSTGGQAGRCIFPIRPNP